MKQIVQSTHNKQHQALLLSLLYILVSCHPANNSTEIGTAKFADTVLFPATTKANLLKSEDLKSRITNGIRSIGKDDDVSNLDLSTLTNVTISFAVFKVYARLIRDGKASSDTEILRLTKTLQKKVVASQLKNFPRIRKAYYKLVKDKLWKHDIDVTLGGANNTTLKFSGGYFAANANIKETQKSLQEILTSLRFKQTQYRWYNGQDEYTYYKIESSKDAILLE